MRALVQRVSSARVEVAGEVVGAIERGLLAYVGFGREDGEDDRAWVLSKIVNVRVFADDAGKMARSVANVGGALLLVSQFTLYGDVRRGRRPSFDDAMPPGEAELAYEALIREARGCGLRVETGRFRAEMLVHAVNEGPVSIWIDSDAAGGRPSRRG